MTTYKGRVSEIIFANEENGYTVLNFATDDDYFTAVGVFPLVGEGEYLEITGEFRKNSKFGEQFVVDNVKFARPDATYDIIRYLSSGLFRGIGEKLATEIVKVFGEDTLDVLENHPEWLRNVTGIGKKKLAEIMESYRETRQMKESILFLQQFGITMGLALKIYARYEEATISAVGANPYILVEDIEGVGFVTADKIAAKMGVDSHSPFRIKAGIIHTLNEAAAMRGHTCYPREKLIEDAANLLKVEKDEVETALAFTFGVKSVKIDGAEMIATELNYRTEKAIATKLLVLKDGAEAWDISWEAELDAYEKSNMIKLHAKQREAVATVLLSGVTVITGGPGTGKTTIIKAITSIASQRGKKVALCAPTGRASKRMTEMTGEEAKTIHRLLGMDFSSNNKFEHGDESPIEADVIIVDEISMADIYIFNALLKAVPRGARLVLVGDKDQLPSVSCGNILSDVISSKLIESIELTEIYRQENTSLIVTNAHRINRGQMPITDNRSDFFISNKGDTMGILNDVISMIKTRIPKFAGVESTDIQVITPIKKGIIGVENLNVEIQNALNPEGKAYEHRGIKYRRGDKVMQTVNNYTITWKTVDGNEMGSGIFNGDMGFISDVYDNGVDVIYDDSKVVKYEGSGMDELTLAYCVSVHKSQGSEFPVVLLALTGANYMIMTRNLLYTAVTRARKMVVIVGDEACVRRMVENNFTARRYSLLKEFLIANESKVRSFWSVDDTE